MNRTSPRAAFSLVELLVVIAVIVILLALLLPAISASRASSRAAQCARQLEQIGAALTKADIGRMTALPVQWMVKLAPYLDDAERTLRCPDDMPTPGGNGSVALPGPGAKTAETSYGINSRAFRFQSGDSHKIVALDYKQAVANVVGQQGTDDWATAVAPRHRGSLHVLLTDGSVQRRKPDEIDPRDCDIHDRLWRPTRDFALVKSGCTRDVSLVPPLPAATSTGTSTTTGSRPPCPGLSNTITVSIAAAGNGGVNEGNTGQTTPLTLTVTLSQPASQAVTVQVVTVDESATVNGNDYQALNQNVAFAAGQINQTVTVNIVGDATSEPNETFRAELRNPTFGGTACAQLSAGSPATITIYNDDATTTPPDPCSPAGTPQELAEATDWLLRHQFADGSWSLAASTHPSCNGQCGPDVGSVDPTVSYLGAGTALALLPLLGSGNSPVKGPHRDAVCRGVNYLMARQWPNGCLSDDGGSCSYTHLISHLVLAEAYENMKDAIAQQCPDSTSGPGGCTVDITALRNSIQRAVSWTVNRQAGSYGWSYVAINGDISHHTWGVTALRVSARAGLTVPASVFDEAKYFLTYSSTNPQTDYGVTIGSRYRYGFMPSVGTDEQTAMGLLCQVYLGVSPQHAAIRQFVNAQNQFLTDPVNHFPLYGNSHMTHLKYLVGGNQWTQWNQMMQAHLAAYQSHAGHKRGSYSMPGNATEQWFGGRLEETVQAMLCQQKYFTGLRLAQ
ncbi:MAG: hypothetical protein K8T91_27080 [Planctomycetes bacterium]|nr:hypothetical protein [Planctomycetota bacterium]